MNTTKLKEALSELRAQRTILDNAISSLEKIIVTMNGGLTDSVAVRLDEAPKSYVDFAVAVLEKHGKPMTAKELTFEVAKLKGEEVQRSSFEGTLFKHIKAAGSNARLEKVGPAIYALPSWPQSTKDLWSQIVQQ